MYGLEMEESIKNLKDKYRITYLIFVLQGVGTIIPLDIFVVTNDYFVKFKLNDTKSGSGENLYQRLFLQNLGFASTVPLLLFTWINIFLPIRGNINVMVIISLVIEIMLSLFTVILAMVNSSNWTRTFFWLTMLTVVMLNMANGVYQCTIFGLASKFPSKYIAAVILGNSISGVFTVIVAIIVAHSHPGLQLQGVYCFIISLAVLMACLDTYLVLPLNGYHRNYKLIHRKLHLTSNSTEILLKETTSYWRIYKKTFPQLANAFMVVFVTSSIFPAVQANIKQCDGNFFIDPYMYTYITCFLTFNIFDAIGCWMATLVRWPSKKYLFIPVLIRLLYIPFFLFSNYQVYGTMRMLPVYIVNDYLYWTVSATMALTSGYWSSVALQYAPTYVKPRYYYLTGMFGSAMMMSGTFFGIIIAYIWPRIIR